MTVEEMQAEMLRLANNRYPMQAKLLIVLLVVVVLVTVGAFAWWQHSEHQKAIILSQEQLKNATTLQQQLDISKQEAAELKSELAKPRKAEIQYVVQERTVEKAAAQVQKDIDAGKSPANSIPADRTVVTPNVQEQKVDVYRISLDKKFAVGGGMILADGHINPVLSVQYNSGRIGYQVIAGQTVAGGIVSIRF